MNGRRPFVSVAGRRCRMPDWAVRQALILIPLAAGVAGIGAIATVQAQSLAPLAALIQQARAGMPLAQCALGNRYHSGRDGLPKSDVHAVKWWEKAAAQGLAPAEENLGNSYHNGWGGLPKSDVQAVKWWEKAATQGYAPAEYLMGLAYVLGVGQLTQNTMQADQWLKKAAAQGYVPATDQLRWLQHQQQAAVRQSRPQSTQVAVVHSARSTPTAPPADHQRVVQSLQLFWNLYFRASDAHVVDFGAPALVSPVSFGRGS